MEQNNIPKKPARRISPFQRNKRLQGTLLSILLVGCSVLFLLLGLIIPDKDFSENENRSLAQSPSMAGLKDGAFFGEMDSYVADQFPGRDSWMSMNLWLMKLLGQKESGGVYLCREDYLIQIPSEPNNVQVQRNLTAANTFAKAHPELNVVMCIAPNAVTVHADKLPANAPVRDQRDDIARIQAGLTLSFVDVTDTLCSHSGEYLYYKTDHHWTSLGAYYAFTALAPALDIQAPELSSYTVYPVSISFEGTLASKSGAHGALDQVDIYVPDTDIEYFVSYPETGEDICSFYRREALEQKDHYTVFFGGNYARLDVTTTADTGRSLLLFKDSYANCMVQFLYPYFDHITIVDPRYYYDNIERIISSEGVTDVLFLYNLDTFLSDSSLADTLSI